MSESSKASDRDIYAIYKYTKAKRQVYLRVKVVQWIPGTRGGGPIFNGYGFLPGTDHLFELGSGAPVQHEEVYEFITYCEGSEVDLVVRHLNNSSSVSETLPNSEIPSARRMADEYVARQKEAVASQ
jgi:hypothetical protein